MKERLLFLFIGLPILFTVLPALLCLFLMRKYGKNWWKWATEEQQQQQQQQQPIQDIEKQIALVGGGQSERGSSEALMNKTGKEDLREGEKELGEDAPVKLTFLQQVHAAGYR